MNTDLESSRYRSLRCNVTLVRISSLDVVGIDVIAAALGNTFKLDARVFVRPDVVVAVLRSLFDTCNLDVLGRTPGSQRSIVDDFARQGLVHALLFAFFNLQEAFGYSLALVLLFGCCLKPVREIVFNRLGHTGRQLDGHLANTTNEIHILTNVAEEGVGGVFRCRHRTTANDWRNRR